MAKQLSPFQAAFAAARKGGEKEFEFEGKKYHTRTKEEEDAKKASPAAKAESPAKAEPAAERKASSSAPSTSKAADNMAAAAQATGKTGLGYGDVAKETARQRRSNRAPVPFGRKARAERAQKEREANKGPKRQYKPRSRGRNAPAEGMKSGGAVKYAKGGSVSKRADGCAIRGKTRGKVL